MKDSYNSYAHLTTRILTGADWDTYKNYYQSLSSPHHYAGYLEEKDLEDPTVAERFINTILNADDSVIFALFDKEIMVGQSSLFITEEESGPRAFLAGSEMADGYRGNRLVNNFYEARMKYLKDINFKGEIMLTIREENLASQKSAARNSFEFSGKLDNNGYQIWTPS